MLHLRAIEMLENTLGPGHPQLALALNNRATMLVAQVTHLSFPFIAEGIFAR